MLTAVVLCLLLCAWSTAQGSQPLQECTLSSMKIVLRSHYNRTGHWQSQVEFVQGPADSQGSNTWQTEVEQRTQDCGEQQFLTTIIDLKAPNSIGNGAVEPPLVPSGYKTVEGVGVAKWSKEVKNRADAVADCAKDDAVLMSVESEAKLKYVNEFFKSPGVFTNAANDRDIWTGVSLVDGVWKTMLGVPVSDIPNFKWMSSRPVDGICAVFAKPYQAHWDSASCSSPDHKLSYICEKRRK